MLRLLTDAVICPGSKRLQFLPTHSTLKTTIYTVASRHPVFAGLVKTFTRLGVGIVVPAFLCACQLAPFNRGEASGVCSHVTPIFVSQLNRTSLTKLNSNARHPDSGMDDPSRDEYLQFLTSSWSDTTFYEFRDVKELVAVAVTDQLDHALSCVYTFYEPTLRSRALGVYAILWQITEAQRLGLTYCYLGYWIEQTRKMRYKADYRPQERFENGRWSSNIR